MYNWGETSSSQKRTLVPGRQTVPTKEALSSFCPCMVCPQTRRIALTATCDSAFPSFFFLILLLTVVNCENSEGASLGEELTFLMVFMLPYVGAILETFSLRCITRSRLSLARHPLWTDQSLSPSFVLVFWLHWVFVVESGLSCPVAWGILVPGPGINLSPLHWKADS